MSFIPMYFMGLTVNIMSLGGIAIAIGAMVDAAIILIENAHKKLEQWELAGRPGSRIAVLIEAFQEVGRSLFFSLLIITISFLPVFTLEAQEGRLFKPLAYTKTFSMFFAAFSIRMMAASTIAPMAMAIARRRRFTDGRVDVVHSHVFHGVDRQHYVLGWNCHCHRSDGRRRHHPD